VWPPRLEFAFTLGKKKKKKGEPVTRRSLKRERSFISSKGKKKRETQSRSSTRHRIHSCPPACSQKKKKETSMLRPPRGKKGACMSLARGRNEDLELRGGKRKEERVGDPRPRKKENLPYLPTKKTIHPHEEVLPPRKIKKPAGSEKNLYHSRKGKTSRNGSLRFLAWKKKKGTSILQGGPEKGAPIFFPGELRGRLS